MAEALTARGVERSAAGLVAELGIAIFKDAFARWLADTNKRDLAHHVRTALGQLRMVAAEAGAT